MHFLKRINQGENSADPRLRSYNVFICNICGHEEFIEIQNNFDITKLRRCPKCKITEDISRMDYLIKKLSDIDQNIAKLSEERDLINLEILSLQPGSLTETSLKGS